LEYWVTIFCKTTLTQQQETKQRAGVLWSRIGMLLLLLVAAHEIDIDD
jgi:hypothetical protein